MLSSVSGYHAGYPDLQVNTSDGEQHLVVVVTGQMTLGFARLAHTSAVSAQARSEAGGVGGMQR
jgi:hypothetical protein